MHGFPSFALLSPDGSHTVSVSRSHSCDRSGTNNLKYGVYLASNTGQQRLRLLWRTRIVIDGRVTTRPDCPAMFSWNLFTDV